jgi:hypothetical protein
LKIPYDLAPVIFKLLASFYLKSHSPGIWQQGVMFAFYNKIIYISKSDVFLNVEILMLLIHRAVWQGRHLAHANGVGKIP